MDKRLAIIGVGKMGSALARGVIKARLVKADRMTAFDADGERLAALARELGFRPSGGPTEAVEQVDAAILAVKPKVMPQVLEEIAGSAGGRLIISIAAGVEIATMESALSGDARVIRAMPNIACSVGEGATAFALGSGASDDDASLAKSLFEAVGGVVQVEESKLHAVTGLSGSGPGFLWSVVEGLVEGGVEAGLDRKTAMDLALRTVVGTARMLQETHQTPAELRDAVATPGGTTAAGLAELEKSDISGAFRRAVEAAARRSKELASDS